MNAKIIPLLFLVPTHIFAARPAAKNVRPVPIKEDAAVQTFINEKLKKLFTPFEYLQVFGAGKRFVDAVEAETNKIVASTDQQAALKEARSKTHKIEQKKYYIALSKHLSDGKPLTQFDKHPLGNGKILTLLAYMINCATKITETRRADLLKEITLLLLDNKKAPDCSGASSKINK